MFHVSAAPVTTSIPHFQVVFYALEKPVWHSPKGCAGLFIYAITCIVGGV